MPVSTARKATRDKAFAALDALDVTEFRGKSLTQIAVLASTTVTYVKAWANERGYDWHCLVRPRNRQRNNLPRVIGFSLQ
jgi:hypothetical protein